VDTPVGELMNIVVDCPDADISARFWAAVLGWERVQENAGWVDIADASDGRRRLVFQQIADYRPPGWPDQGPPQQLHLDVRVDDLEGDHADEDVAGREASCVVIGEPLEQRVQPFDVGLRHVRTARAIGKVQVATMPPRRPRQVQLELAMCTPSVPGVCCGCE
jgi:catechol 2,3-dioxygenase-like lactoylglutathione lyase family enzyme